MSEQDTGSETQAEAPASTDAAPEAEAASSEPTTPKSRKKRSKLPLLLIGVVIIGLAGLWGWQQLNTSRTVETTTTLADDDADEPAAVAEPSAAREATTRSPEPSRTEMAPDLIPPANQADIDALKVEIDALRREVADLSATLADQGAEADEQSRTLSRLRSEQQERIDLLDSLPGRVRNTEEALARLQGISSGSQRAWLLAEAEYYMQLANAQLQLANNPELATEALRLADQRVRELADPTFTPVRRALAEEIASLATLSTGDIEGASLTIGSLMGMVDALPIDQDVRAQASADDTSEAGDTEETGWARMKDKVGGALGSFVRVRKSNAPLEPLLPAEAESFLRLNLKLQLQSARSALLLGEHAAYRQGLSDVREWVTLYFDMNDSGVQSMLAMLDEVDDARRSSARPDISGSLTLLRQQLEIGDAAE